MTAAKQKALRFAALRRVSTEKQERRGESLRVQTQQIEQAVNNLGGKIVEWYGGQEHATPGYEKKEIDRLLTDAQKKRFDCIMVSDPDRWSRDNEKSERSLEILWDAGIRFFCQETDYDLSDPNARLFLGVSAVIGRYFTANQKKKSYSARVSRAKRGCCTSGKKPWGRIWNKDTLEWEIDIDKQTQLVEMVNRYLAGESLTLLAAEYGMKHANIYFVLRHRCGTEWTQTFYPNKRGPKDKGEPVVVSMKIPELLPETTIAAIHKRLDGNKTYGHGSLKYDYLLSRMVFCEHCGAGLSGQANHSKKQYYRHIRGPGTKPCTHPHTWIRAEEIEELVILKLFETFGNPKAVEQAIERATGDLDKIKWYRERLARITAELEKIEKGRKRVLDLVFKGSIRQELADAQLKDANEREVKLREERDRIAGFLSDRPSPEQVKNASVNVAKQFQRLTNKKNVGKSIAGSKPLSQMSWEEKRSLCEAVFSGKTPDGKRMGVYVRWNDEGSDWTFSIRGHLIEEEGLIRLSESMKEVLREHYEDGAGWTAAKQRKLKQRVSSSVSDCPSGRRPY